MTDPLQKRGLEMQRIMNNARFKLLMEAPAKVRHFYTKKQLASTRMPVLSQGAEPTNAESVAADFSGASEVNLHTLIDVATLPAMPVALSVRLDNLPALTTVPEMAMAKTVKLWNLRKISSLPDFPAAEEVTLINLPDLTAFPAMPKARRVRIAGCPAAAGLPVVPETCVINLNGKRLKP